MNKRWLVKQTISDTNKPISIESIMTMLLENRSIGTSDEKDMFLSPPLPLAFTAEHLGIDTKELETSIHRIEQAIRNKESIIVYADYDADGITAGAVMWESIHQLGGKVMPYIPHRVEEGYGLSTIGIDAVKKEYDATLIITVDHGITGWEKVEYAKKKGIDVIVTDHHTKQEILPAVPIVHTTATSGAGVSWFVAKELLSRSQIERKEEYLLDLLGLATMGIIADLLPLTHINRSLVYHGLLALSKTQRPGIKALIKDSGIIDPLLSVYHVSHILAPRLNAMGRLEHALDALRLLCTKDSEKAELLARRLTEVNKERQQLTMDTALHAMDAVRKDSLNESKKILILADEMYNPGIIGLAAGRLVEEFYLPSIVLSRGETISKASARSIPGFNIVEALREAKEFLLEVGGHPMAAGFSIETARIPAFQEFLEGYALAKITDDLCVRSLTIDIELPLSVLSSRLSSTLLSLAPFGMGNPTPVFASREAKLFDARTVGANGKHLKLKVVPKEGGYPLEAIGFNMGDQLPEIEAKGILDVAYTLEENEWNGKKTLQLKVKDIAI